MCLVIETIGLISIIDIYDCFKNMLSSIKKHLSMFYHVLISFHFMFHIQCRYFLNFFVDCTVGVLIVFIVHGFICNILQKLGFTSFGHIGEYGDPPNKYVWAAQCSVYITALMINKVIVCSIFFATLSPVNEFADWLFSPLWPTPELELIVVMVMCPFLLTSLQFLMFDYMLKAQTGKSISGGDDDDGINSLGSSLLDKESEASFGDSFRFHDGSGVTTHSTNYLSIDFETSGLPLAAPEVDGHIETDSKYLSSTMDDTSDSV